MSDDARQGIAPRAAWLILAVTAVLFVVAWRRVDGPPPEPRAAPAVEFSAERAMRVLTDVVVGTPALPRPIGSAAGAAARARVTAELAALGWSPGEHRAVACTGRGTCGPVVNVLARRAGDGSLPGAILLCAHVDSVAAGPGAADDGSGVAILLESARALAQEKPLPRDVILLADDGEEVGLLGARAFCDEHPWAKDVRAVVNLDARGTSGASAMFETSTGNAGLIAAVAPVLPRPFTSSLFYEAYKVLPNDTDLTVFKQHGIAGVNFAFIGDVPDYHTPHDSPQALSQRSLQHQGASALACVRALAAAPESAFHAEGDASWFDVLSLGVARMSALATAVLGLVATALVALAWALGARRGLHAGPALLGLLCLPLAVACTVILSSSRDGGWARLTGLASILAVVALVKLVERIGAWATWAGTWGAMGLLGAVTAVARPGAAHVFVVPALVAGLAAAAVLLLRRGDAGATLPTLAGVVATTILWAPLCKGLLLMLGPGWPMGLAPAACLALPLAALSPSLSGLVPAWRRAWRWALPALLLAVVLVPRALPPGPTIAPSNIAFVQDAATGKASWLLRPDAREALPEAAGVMPFAAEPAAPFPWRPGDLRLAAAAEPLSVAPPMLEVLSDSRGPSGRELVVRLSSPRGAPVGALHVRAPEGISEARIEGRVALSDQAPSETWRSLRVAGLPAEGVTIRLLMPGEGRLEARIADVSYGLPEGGEPLKARRDERAPAWGEGDVTLVFGHPNL